MVAADQVSAGLALLLGRAGCDDDYIALAGFFVLGGADAGAGVAVIGCVAEVLDLSVAELGLGVYEENFGGDLVVLV